MDKKLLDYIKQNKKQGFSDEQIKKSLLDAGWKEEDIDQGFKSKKKSKWLVSVIVIVGILIIAGVVVGFYDDIKGLFIKETEKEVIEDEFKDWKTYQNEEYGWEIQYPEQEVKISENYPSSEPSIVFPSNDFRVIIDINYTGNISDYRYMNLEPQETTERGFQIFSLQNASVPFIAFAKEFNNKVYIIEFHGDIELNYRESQILSTFKFTPLETP